MRIIHEVWLTVKNDVSRSVLSVHLLPLIIVSVIAHCGKQQELIRCKNASGQHGCIISFSDVAIVRE